MGVFLRLGTVIADKIHFLEFALLSIAKSPRGRIFVSLLLNSCASRLLATPEAESSAAAHS
jgi:hypothetical protein